MKQKTPSTQKEKIKKLLKNRLWRLNNLYWIENKKGKLQRFKLNHEQTILHNNLWYRNDVLKARQLGISTYTAILILDTSLFTPHHHAGIIDKTLDDAKDKLSKITLAYDLLDYIPPNPTKKDLQLAYIGSTIKKRITIKGGVTQKKFSNGALIRIGTNLRGGTYQLLHISELGEVSKHNPRKARKIVTGALNTVSSENIIIIETTEEAGKYGEHYQICKSAMENTGKTLTPLDYKFFFFPWHHNPEYTLPLINPNNLNHLPEELINYFAELQKQNIHLTPEQKNWYYAKWNSSKYSIKQEFPSAPNEPFEVIAEGAIYGPLITNLRAQGRTNATYNLDPLLPVYTSLDLGISDWFAIWYYQIAGPTDIRIIDHYVASGLPISHYADKLLQWQQTHKPITTHYLPHDATTRDLSHKTPVDLLALSGITNTKIVPRTPDIWAGINAVRELLLPHATIHARCSTQHEIGTVTYPSGLESLENYTSLPPGANGNIRETPCHNYYSHSADALRTFAEAILNGLVPKLHGNHSPIDLSRRKKRPIGL